MMKKIYIILLISFLAFNLIAISSCRFINPFYGESSTKLLDVNSNIENEDLGTGTFYGEIGNDIVTVGVTSEVSFAFTLLVDEDDNGNPIKPLYQTVILDENYLVLIQTDAQDIQDGTIKKIDPQNSSNVVVLFVIQVNPENPTNIYVIPKAISTKGFIIYEKGSEEVGSELKVSFIGTLIGVYGPSAN